MPDSLLSLIACVLGIVIYVWIKSSAHWLQRELVRLNKDWGMHAWLLVGDERWGTPYATETEALLTAYALQEVYGTLCTFQVYGDVQSYSGNTYRGARTYDLLPIAYAAAVTIHEQGGMPARGYYFPPRDDTQARSLFGFTMCETAEGLAAMYRIWEP